MATEANSSQLKRIRRYDIIRPIGEGGMAKVYLALDKIIRRQVAIKVFSLEGLPPAEERTKKVMRDFFLETQTAGALLHPNIVVIYDVGKKRDLLYIVMEFVYGKTILQHQRKSPFSIRKSVELVYELAMALDYAHSRGVVHRDIKPENIIISTQGIPKITDFGIARFRKHLRSQRQSLVGSSRFMAPEQVLRREQDHRVDIYQLGVVLFELVTRQTPFKGITAEETMTKICTEQCPPPGRINPEVPGEIDQIVTKCLEKSPSRRFGTARELAEALAGTLRTGIHRAILPDRKLVRDLRKLEIFSLFTDQEIQDLIKAGEFVTCRGGEHIIRENETDSNFFVLLDGNVQVVKRSRTLSDFPPGSCFGAIGAFARQRRSAGVVCETEAKLLRINAVLFRKLEPTLQIKLLDSVLRDMASLVISLDAQLTKFSEGQPSEISQPSICPVCGFDNQAPIEVCRRCGAIPANYDQTMDAADQARRLHGEISDEDETQEYPGLT